LCYLCSFSLLILNRKLIAGDVPNHDDLEGVDFSLVKTIDMLRNIDKNGVNKQTFSETFFETFTTTSSDDRIVELLPGGKSVDVTYENRQQYCDLVLQVGS
jgi:E3 ubiquitin-protein ligase HERC1